MFDNVYMQVNVHVFIAKNLEEITKNMVSLGDIFVCLWVVGLFFTFLIFLHDMFHLDKNNTQFDY